MKRSLLLSVVLSLATVAPVMACLDSMDEVGQAKARQRYAVLTAAGLTEEQKQAELQKMTASSVVALPLDPSPLW